MNKITYNGVNLSDTYGVFYDGSQLYDTPDKDITFFPIPGKNGDLSISNDRFNNIEIKIDCFIRSNFQENYSDLVNFLYSQEGYCNLETTTESDIYRSAQFVNAMQPQTGTFLKYGTFTLVFNCKPQKWLKTGDTAIAVSGTTTITNPSQFASKPLIEVEGTGTTEITINDSILVLTDNVTTTYIDCEIEDAYDSSSNRNGNLTVTNGFPLLKPGENTITTTQAVNIYPRWWKL